MKMINYRKNLAENLNKKFTLNCSENDLKSVVSRDDFETLINKFTQEDFSVGYPLTDDNNVFFKNVTDGNFRVTLHNHTFFSDGRLSPEEFINQAAEYADRVAKINSNNKEIPPFTLALTDHDEIRGSIEILKCIAQNPEKYKNVRFICGAELSAKLEGKDFDLTALCVDPFDKNLTEYLDKIKDLRTISAKKYIEKVNVLDGSNYTLEEFAKLGFNGKRVLLNRSGLVYLEHVKKILLMKFSEKYGKDSKYLAEIKRIYKEFDYANLDTQDVRTVIKLVKAAGGVVSWTHPARTFKNIDDLDWHEEFFLKLKALGVDGVEANQQYTHKHYTQDIKNLSEKNALYRKLAKENGMFLSGGTDSHEFNVFAHHQLIDDELLKTFF